MNGAEQLAAAIAASWHLRDDRPMPHRTVRRLAERLLPDLEERLGGRLVASLTEMELERVARACDSGDDAFARDTVLALLPDCASVADAVIDEMAASVCDWLLARAVDLDELDARLDRGTPE